MASLQPPLFGSRMSDRTGYRVWYNAHASDTVRLPRRKPFASSMVLQEDDIGRGVGTEGRAARGRKEVRRDWIVERGERKEGGRSLLHIGGRRGGSGALADIKAGGDGHVAMHDETLQCVAWKRWAPLTSLDQR